MDFFKQFGKYVEARTGSIERECGKFYVRHKINRGKEYYIVGRKTAGGITWKRVNEDELKYLRCLEQISKINKKELQILEKTDAFLNMVKDSYLKLQKEKYNILKETGNEAGKGNHDFLKDGCIFKTKKGDFVRSKSEVFIADTLFEYGIPYEYEKEMFEGLCHPDFVISDNITGLTVIWEHFGLMNNPEYVLGYIKKLQMYKDHGFEINVNLICTYEFAGSGGYGERNGIIFGSKQAEDVVREWFLP